MFFQERWIGTPFVFVIKQEVEDALLPHHHPTKPSSIYSLHNDTNKPGSPLSLEKYALLVNQIRQKANLQTEIKLISSITKIHPIERLLTPPIYVEQCVVLYGLLVLSSDLS